MYGNGIKRYSRHFVIIACRIGIVQRLVRVRGRILLGRPETRVSLKKVSLG